MAIMLRTPAIEKNKRFEFDVTNDNRIQIRSLDESGIPGEPFHYHLDAIRDLYLWLLENQENDGWVLLSPKGEEGDEPIEGSVEAWGRNQNNPIGGFYGLDNGRRGRFATFIPPILEYMGLAEVEHNHQGNHMRARR